jgi:WD40 repeat protein/tRNA A-37 threonylcarbamoyl transferase component Bud32
MAAERTITLLDRLREAELLEPGQLSALAALPEARDADPRALGRVLLQRRLLSRFQINLAAQGRAKDLFVGPFLVLDKLGEGGMGQVYKAQHLRMKRVVALKVIRKEKLASPDSVRRFYQEVEAAAQLSHPNIVLAYDAGQAGNTHYLSMEYVEGTDLNKLVKDAGPLPVTLACEYVRQVALALQHAHEKGLVHRDIKPHNMLLARSGEGPGRVKLLDMGLARLSGQGETSLTQTGQVIGTPDYLAPEQALDARSADTRSDIYSLGCTLYFLLSGSPPYIGDTLAQVLLKHQMEEPAPLAQKRSDIPPGLEAVLRRMMAKKPEARFQTPAEVAQALEPLARGEAGAVVTALPPAGRPAPGVDSGNAWATLSGDEQEEGVVARPGRKKRERDETQFEEEGDAPARRARRKAKSKTGMYILAGLGVGVPLLGLAVLGAILLGGSGKEGSAKDKVAGKDSTKPRDGKKEKGGKKDGGKQPGDDPAPGDPEPVAYPRKHHSVKAHDGPARALAVSPDGRLAATGGDDQTVALWDLRKMRLLRRFPKLPGKVTAVGFSPDGLRLRAAAGSRLHEWMVDSKRPVGKPRKGRYLSPDGRWALSLGEEDGEGTLRVWDLADGTDLGGIKTASLSLLDLAFSRSGERALAVNADHTIDVFNLKRLVRERRLNVGPRDAKPTAMACTRGEGRVVVGFSDGSVHEVDTTLLRVVGSLRGKHAGAVGAVAISQDGKRVLSAGADGVVRLWRQAGGREVGRFPGHVGMPRRVAFLPGNHALSCGDDGTLRLWDLRQSAPLGNPPRDPRHPGPSPREMRRLTGMREAVNGLSCSPDGRRALAVGANALILYHLETGKQIWQRDAHTGRINSLAVSHDWKRALTGSQDGTVRLWDVEKGKELKCFDDFEAWVYAVAISPDGTKALAGYGGLKLKDGKLLSKDGRAVQAGYGVRLWDLESGKLLAGTKLPTATFIVAFSLDGQRALYKTAEEDLKVWDIEGKKALPPIKGVGFWQMSLAWAPDGRHALLGGPKEKLSLWDLQKGKRVRNFVGHSAQVNTVAVSRDGKWAVSGAGEFVPVKDKPPARKDCSLCVWDYESGEEVLRIPTQNPIRSVALSPDRKFALSGDERGNLIQWDLRKKPPEGVAPGASPRQMRRVTGLGGMVTAVSCSPNGRRALAVAGANLHLVSLETGKPIHVFRGHQQPIAGLAVSRSWKRALTGSSDGTARLWDLEEHKELKCFDDFEAWIHGIAMSPDGTKGLAGLGGLKVKAGKGILKDGKWVHAESGVRLWNLKTGKELQVITTKPSHISLLTFSPDGGRFLFKASDPGLRGWDFKAEKELSGVAGLGYGLFHLAWAPDGRHALISGPSEKLRLWDLQKGKRVRDYVGHTAHINAVAVSADGKWAVSGAGGRFLIKDKPPELKDCTLRVWDYESGEEVLRIAARDPIRSVALSRDRKFALTGDEGGNLIQWDLRKKPAGGKAGGLVRSFPGEATGVSISPDGERALAAGRSLRLYDLAKGKEAKVLGSGACLAVTPDWKRALTGGTDGMLRLWDLDEGKQLKALDCKAEAFAVAISRDGKYGIAGLGGRQTKAGMPVQKDGKPVQAGASAVLWDLAEGKEMKHFKLAARGMIGTVGISPDGRRAYYGLDRQIYVWDLKTRKDLPTIWGVPYYSRIVWAPDGRHALLAGRDAKLGLWDMEKGKRVRSFVGHKASVASAALSADGKRVVTGGFHVGPDPKGSPPTVRVWDYATGKELAKIPSETSILCLAISPDRKFVLFGDRKGGLTQWALPEKAVKAVDAPPPEKEPKGVDASKPLALKLWPWWLAVSRDGRYAAVCDREIAVFDLKKREELKRWPSPAGYTRCVAFASDGKHLFSGGKDGKLYRWDFTSGEEVTVYKGHTDWITVIAVSPDGKLVASGSGELRVKARAPSDFTVRIWDVATGKQKHRLEGHKGTLRGLCFSPSGGRLLSLSTEGALIVWNPRTGKLVKALKVEAPRNPQQAGLCCSADGRRVVFSAGKNFQVWDLTLGRLLYRVEHPEADFSNAVFCDKVGRRVLTGTTGWLRRGGRPVIEDGRLVLPPCTVRLWDAKTGKTLRSFEGHTHHVVHVWCSPDGKRAHSVGWDQTLRTWKLDKKD